MKFYDGKKVLRQIQENEIDITVNDDKGNTILHVAAENGDSETIKLLIGKGADVSATNEDGYTPLVNAAKKGDLESVKTLIEDGGADATDNAVLHFAAWKGGDFETVKYIVGCNAEIYEGDIILSKTEEIKQYLQEAQVRRQRIKNMQKDGRSSTRLLQD